MFKKTKIAAVSAAVLGLSSLTAQAVSVNEAGSHGEVLIFPYYNVNSAKQDAEGNPAGNGFLTSFNITNTTGDTKAIKIRFRESGNSNDVLDFNLYMSPYDVFTMNLTKGADGGVLLTTEDKTCTHPAIPANGVAFRHNAYKSTDISDTREGYLEVIEMGVIDEGAYIIGERGPQNIASSIEHVDGVPRDCGVIEAAWQQGVFVQGGAESNGRTPDDINWVDAKPTGYPVQFYSSDRRYYGKAPYVKHEGGGVTTGALLSKDEEQLVMLAPKGGIVGTSILVDKDHFAAYVAEPLAVTNYSSVAQHYLSSDEKFYLLPSLSSGAVQTPVWGTVRRDFGLDDPDIATDRPSIPSGINPMPIAEAMLVTDLGNQYFLGTGALTDWVVSAPMRKHAIYNNYQYVPFSSDPSYGYVAGKADDVNEDGTPNYNYDVPVNGVIGDVTAPFGYWAYLADANDVNATFDYWDREEDHTTPSGDDFSPPILTPDVRKVFPREVNIFSLTSAESSGSVLGSTEGQELAIENGFVNGWGKFTFDSAVYDLTNSRYAAWVRPGMGYGNDYGYGNGRPHDHHSKGVPLFGFMSARVGTDTLNVGETFPHFYTRDLCDCLLGVK